ncbi:MAG TPA: hypothetical protein VNV16_12480 [Methylibium sp.]|nr:hypothetical protein [Methylibium sp.]
MTALLLFAATFGVVFALGLQSLNVNGGHRVLAFVTSFAIGISNLVLFKVLPGPTDAWQIAAYLLGGPFGIWASMVAHPHLVRWLARWRQAEPLRTRAVPARGRSKCEQLALDLLDPEAFGHAVTAEVRDRARDALGLQTTEAPLRRRTAPVVPDPRPEHLS